MNATQSKAFQLANAPNEEYLTTAQFGHAIKRSGQTIRKNLCLTGHAYGVRPRRIGGRLLWPKADVDKLLEG